MTSATDGRVQCANKLTVSIIAVNRFPALTSAFDPRGATLGPLLHLNPVSLDELFIVDVLCHKMLIYSH